MSSNSTKVIQLPDLSNEHWILLFNAFVGPVDIPTADRIHGRGDEPARALIVNAVSSDHALDELPEDHPVVERMLGPFLDLTEAEATAALAANNIMWQTDDEAWQAMFAFPV